MADSPADSDKPQSPDSRLRAFLRKAGPILKAERGLNARSRVKLESLARDMKLPEELFEKGLQELQENPSGTAEEWNRWEQAFAKRLRSQMQKLKGGILNAKQEHRAVEVGTEKYQLDELRAREVIQTVARELGIGRITRSTAERHLDELVREKVGRATWIDRVTKDLLHDAGTGWGLSVAHVETVVSHYLEENRSRLLRRRRAQGIVTALGTLLALVAMVAIFLWTFSRSPSDRESSRDNNTQQQAAESDNQIVTFPAWWDESLQLASVKVRLELEGFEEVLPQITATDPQTRAAGYQRLVSLYDKQFAQREVRRRLDSFLADLFTREPDGPTAKQLLASWLALADPALESSAPETAEVYSKALGSLGAASRLLPFGELEEAKQAAILDEISGRTGVVELQGRSSEERERATLAGLLTRLYRNLIQHANDELEPVIAAQQLLHPLATEQLSPARWSELATQLALEVLDEQPAEWTLLQPMLTELTRPENPLLFRLVTLAETTSNVGLQRFLLRDIARALEIDPAGISPEELAGKLRRAIGAVPGMREEEDLIRWAKLRREQNQLPRLSDVIDAPIPPAPAITAQLMHTTTLAYALGAEPSRGSEFDVRLQEGPPEWRTPPPPSATNAVTGLFSEDISRAEIERLERSVTRLRNWETQPVLNRMRALRGVQSVVPKVRDLAPPAARQLAQYILGAKEPAEQAEVNQALRELAKWNHLLLALADELDSSRLDRAAIEAAVVACCGEAIRLEGEQTAREVWRRQLLAAVRDRLASRPGVDEVYGQQYNRLAEVYTQQLVARTAFWDPRGRAVREDSPAALLEAWLRQRPLARPAATEEAEDWVKRWQAIRYLTRDDLSRTVLLENLLLEQLASTIRQRRPERSAAVDELLSAFQDQDDRVQHLVTQLYLREWYQLELLRLLAP